VTLDEFWDHIRATRRRDPDAHSARLAKRLAKLPVVEILDFVRLWDEMETAAYQRDLWGAAYLINGGCSDDGFQYFRWWLLLQGRAVYEAAVTNPDTLASVVDGEEEVEAEVGPGMDAWFLATGTKKDEAGYDAYGLAVTRHRPKGRPLPELAPRWDFDNDDEVRKRFPRLAKMYLDRN
jgi:hypothetical protein